MEICDEDVRIKSTAGSLGSSTSMEKLKTPSPSKQRGDETKKIKFNSSNSKIKKGKTILRSQSISNPQTSDVHNVDYNSSTISINPTTSQTPEKPILTFANTVNDKSNITIGFDVDDKKESN